MAKRKDNPSAPKGKPTGYRRIAGNKKASHLYHLEERFEAGVALTGTEVKSLRGGKGSIAEAFGRIRNSEVWLLNADIPVYEMRGYANHEPKRPRKLLLHGGEIRKIVKALAIKGYTLVPTSLYFNDRGLVKVQIALAKGKRKADKRQDVRERSHKRDMDRELSRRSKGR
ncbi:MAG: SsrA-binding protein SmpB [Planctomycetota bacterium]